MTYKSVVLSKTPALFYYPDMVGPATNGDVIPDLSGNGLDGVLSIANSPEPYGFPSPIETDADSKAFAGHDDGTLSPAQHCFISRPSDSLIEPAGNFALGSWLQPATPGAAIPQPLVWKAGDPFVFGDYGTCFIGIDLFGANFVGGCVDTAGTLWTVADSSGSAGDLLHGDFYRVLLVRQVNGLYLYVNRSLRAQTTITSGLGTKISPHTFFVHPSQTAPLDCRYCAVEFYTHSLSAADELEIYEAARNQLPMYATITAKSSVIADLTPPATYATFPYSHNFEVPIIERLARPTALQQLKDGTEERAGRATKTRRKIRHQVTIMDARARRQFAAFLRYNQGKPVAWPISQDETQLTAALTAGDTVIDVDTSYKDFDPDGRAVLFTSEFDFEQVEILSLDPLTTKQPLANSWPVSARIVPLKLAYLEQQLEIVGATSEFQDSELTVSILVEDIADAPNRITAYTPGYTYRGAEVFDPRVWGLSNYEEPLNHDSSQQSELLDAATGILRIDSDVAVSQPGFGYNLELWDRETISKFLGWFEERAGRLKNLWVPTFQEDFKLVSISGSTITIKETNYQATYNLDSHSRDICLVQYDGTLAFRRISSVAPSGANEVLTVDSSVSSLASTTREICFLRMCRLDADEVELAWWTDNMVSAALRFREVLGEIS